MADKKDLSNDMEMSFLGNVEGVNPELFEKQIKGEELPPKEDIVPPHETPPTGGEQPPVQSTKQEVSTPPVQEPVKLSDEQISEQRSLFLKEIFGDKYNSVDDVKNANILGTLNEVESLRQTNTELQEKLDKKPKTNFADDEVALYNEFVKSTGNRDYGLFKKVNSELANISDMDALVANYVMNFPNTAGRESEVRAHFEKKYGFDSEENTFEDSFGMQEDAYKARKALQDVKDKLVVPEQPAEEPSAPKELSPEQKETLTNQWSGAGSEIKKALSTLKIPIKDGKDIFLDYAVPESELESVAKWVTETAVGNQMEPNDANAKQLGQAIYNQLIVNNLPQIVHAASEKARSMAEEKYSEMFHNPSPSRNNDQPPAPQDTRPDEDKMSDQIFDLEFGE